MHHTDGQSPKTGYISVGTKDSHPVTASTKMTIDATSKTNPNHCSKTVGDPGLTFEDAKNLEMNSCLNNWTLGMQDVIPAMRMSSITEVYHLTLLKGNGKLLTLPLSW
jgi:hypothetical protein